MGLEALNKPLSAATFVSALYSTMGEYHVMRDEPAPQLSTAVKIEALRLVNSGLSNLTDSTGLELLFSIVSLGAGSMNYTSDWTDCDRHLQAAGLLADLHKGVILSTPFGASVPRMLSFQKFRRLTADISANTGQTVVQSLPTSDSPELSEEDMPAATRNPTELGCYCPLGFDTLSYSGTCKPAILDILWHIYEVKKAVHMGTPTPQHRATKNELNRIHFQWLQKLPSARVIESQNYNDFIYECCRLTALLQMSMIEDHRVIDARSIVTQLKEALKKTELADHWGNMLGVLWWVLTSKRE